MPITDSIISAESGGDPNAQNPNSSASGPGQFIDSTWLATLKAHRPDIAQGQTDDALLTLKTNPQLAAEMTGAYAKDNQAVLQQNNLPVTPGTTYLAHFAGPSGAVKVLQADPSTPVSDILGPAVVKANPFLAGMTAQGLQAWAAKKMGTTLPQAGVQSAPSAPGAPPMQGPQTGQNGTNSTVPQVGQVAPGPTPQAIPPQQQPIFPPQLAQAMQQIGQAAQPQQPAGFAQIPTAPQLPLFAAAQQQRRPIDLSALRAALAARTPIFPTQG